MRQAAPRYRYDLYSDGLEHPEAGSSAFYHYEMFASTIAATIDGSTSMLHPDTQNLVIDKALSYGLHTYAYIVMAYIVMAYVAMAYIVMAYMVMAYVAQSTRR